MTTLSKPIRRETVHPYRVTLTGCFPANSGRQIVVELADDMIKLREKGRRAQVEIGIPELYRVLLVRKGLK